MSTYNWGELTHLNDPWDEPPSTSLISSIRHPCAWRASPRPIPRVRCASRCPTSPLKHGIMGRIMAYIYISIYMYICVCVCKCLYSYLYIYIYTNKWLYIYIILFNGTFRILKWRYCTIFSAIFCGDIPLHRPYISLIYGRYLQFRFLQMRVPPNHPLWWDFPL